MGKIYCIMGKSASGKDTIYKRVLSECPELERIVLYTTRPMRDHETEGVEYHYTTSEGMDRFRSEGAVIEERTYDTVFGPWTYATVDDGTILPDRSYAVIGTLESYPAMRDRFGSDRVVPVYIEVDPGVRLQRALDRENAQQNPHYAEMCRRFLADEEDFSEEKIAEAGIEKRYVNEDLEVCLARIISDIRADGRGEKA